MPAPLSAAALDDLKVNTALAALLRYSLVVVEGSGKERVLSVHRLLQEVTRERLPEDEKSWWITAALQIVNQAFRDNGFDDIDAPQLSVLLWPGLQLQRLTTRQPTMDQLEVAAAALEEVMAMDAASRQSVEGTVPATA